MSVSAKDILATFDQQQKPVNGKTTPAQNEPTANDILSAFDQTVKKKEGGTTSSDSAVPSSTGSVSPSQLTLPSATKKTFNYFNLGTTPSKVEEYKTFEGKTLQKI